MPPATCPDISVIEKHACGDTVDTIVILHIDTCEVCKARLEIAKEDAKFVTRARSLLKQDVEPFGVPRIAGYKNFLLINAGSQGIVYKATQESTSRQVAIKILNAGRTATVRQRLRAEREAEIAAKLAHPAIVTIYESRTLPDGRIAMVMEFIDGVPLDDWTPPGETESEKTRALLRAFAMVCDGIHHAHMTGVIHRDLKPDNILVTADGRPVVVDFGIAKADNLHQTSTGEFAGTPAYSSPEQVLGKPTEVNALTDIYSLGVILYKLLANDLPYKVDGSIFDIARTISETEPVPLRQKVPHISLDLDAISQRALQKKKELRYRSAAELGHDVERYLEGRPVEARSASGWYLLQKAVLLNRGRLAWAIAAVVLVAGTGAAVVVSLSRAADAEKRAKVQQLQAQTESFRAQAVSELLRETVPSVDVMNIPAAGTSGSALGRLFFKLETGGFDDEVDQNLRRLWGDLYAGVGSGRMPGLVAYAEVSLRNGLVRLRMEHGAEHPEIAATMHELAGVLLVRGRLEEAERYGRDALAMRQRLLPKGDLAIGESKVLLARIYLSQHKKDEAMRMSDDALATLSGLPTPQGELPIASMLSLRAKVHLEAGDFTKCESELMETLRIRMRRLSPDDPDVLETLGDAANLASAAPNSEITRELAKAWGVSGDDAAGAVRKELSVMASSDRPDYPRVRRLGRSEALGHYIKLQEALLSPDDISLVGSLVAQMRAAEGEKLIETKVSTSERAAAILSKRFGEKSFPPLVCVQEHAMALVYAGRPEEAIKPGLKAREIWENVPLHARDLTAMGNTQRLLAWFMAMAGHYPQAEKEFDLAIKEMTEGLAPKHVIAMAQVGRAWCLAEQSRIPEADAISKEWLGAAEALATTPGDLLAHMQFMRARILMKMGDYKQARVQLEKTWDPVYKFAGAPFAGRRMMIAAVVECCRQTGDVKAAEEWQGQLDVDPALAEVDQAEKPKVDDPKTSSPKTNDLKTNTAGNTGG